MHVSDLIYNRAAWSIYLGAFLQLCLHVFWLGANGYDKHWHYHFQDVSMSYICALYQAASCKSFLKLATVCACREASASA